MITAIQGLPPIVIAPSDNNKTDNKEHKASSDVVAETVNTIMQKQAQSAERQEEKKAKEEDQEKDSKLSFSSLEEKLKSKFQFNDVAFKFSIDKDSKELVLKVVDTETDEIIRQIPSDLAMKIARFVADQLDHGQVTDAKV